MSKNLKTQDKIAVDRYMSLTKKAPLHTTYHSIKKAPAKMKLLPQSTACGGVAVGADSIPPAKRNKKSKL